MACGTEHLQVGDVIRFEDSGNVALITSIGESDFITRYYIKGSRGTKEGTYQTSDTLARHEVLYNVCLITKEIL